MPFKVFDEATAAAKNPATMAIQQRGVLALNRAAFVQLGEPKAVELLYDENRQLVGVRAADPRVRHSQSVRPNAKASTYLVSASRFIKHYDIPNEVGHRWPAEMEDDVLFIDLSKPPLI